MKSKGQVHGVLVVDKPRGPTSHDVVTQLRRTFGTRRIGHAGTLDPMATGVLVVLLGEATKLSSVLTRDVKSYEATVEFGRATDTLDAEGKTTRKVDLPADFPDRARLRVALEVELQRELQVPPQVSAIQVGGQRAYDVARRGETLDLAPRSVFVHGLELLDVGERSLSARLTVSKGYYVRSFARDLGSSLDVPAHLTALRRIASGPFSLRDAAPWPPLADAPLLSVIEAALRSLPHVEVSEEGELRLRQGKVLRPEDQRGSVTPPRASSGPLREAADEDDEGELVAAVRAGRLLALVQPAEEPGHFRVRRGFEPTLADPAAAVARGRGLHPPGSGS